MNILTKSLLIGVAAAGLVLLWDTFASRGKEKLQSVRIVVEATPNPSSSFTEEEVMKLTQKGLDDRMKASGYSYKIRKEAAKSFEIIIRNIDDFEIARNLIASNGKVEFWEMHNLLAMAPFFTSADTIAAKYLNPEPKKTDASATGDSLASDRSLKRFSSADNPEAPERKGFAFIIQFQVQQFRGPGGRDIYPAALGYIHAKDTGLLNKIVADPAVSLPSNTKFYYGPADARSKDPKQRALLALYAINTRGRQSPPLGNDDIAKATAEYNQAGDAELRLEFSIGGSKRWANMTGENIDRPIGIIVNDIVVSAPIVNDRIEGGIAQISGGFTLAEVKALAMQLSTPKVPANLEIVLMEHIVEEKPIFQLRTLLLALAGLVIGSGAAYMVFKMLKTS